MDPEPVKSRFIHFDSWLPCASTLTLIPAKGLHAIDGRAKTWDRWFYSENSSIFLNQVYPVSAHY